MIKALRAMDSLKRTVFAVMMLAILVGVVAIALAADYDVGLF